MKILAAEDNPIFQSVLRSMLTKWGYDVVMGRDGEEALAILQSNETPRLAILDWMMPGIDGVEVCRRVRAAGKEPYIYILLLTARTDSQDLVEALEAGADDYLTKPFNTLELRARLRAGRRIVELQEELLVAREALRVQATHDSLTGLLNRAAILEVLQTELARASRESQPVSVLMVDLDHFKRINDHLGHQAGDTVLREAARRMASAIRRYDSIGRYGGEEFLVILPGCTSEGALAQAERLRLAVGAEPIDLGRQSVPVTCSLGCACCADAPSGTSDSLVREADGALYGAKEGGRNRIVVAETELAAM
jgi:diguanylate cyclase (GGDEF)-like protein